MSGSPAQKPLAQAEEEEEEVGAAALDPEVVKADALRQSVLQGDWKEFVRVVTHQQQLNGRSPLVVLMEWFHQWQQEYEALVGVLEDQLQQQEDQEDQEDQASQMDKDIEEMEEEARGIIDGFGEIALHLAQQIPTTNDKAMDQVVDKYGWTLLMQAANSGLGQLMKFLLTVGGADANYCVPQSNLNALFLAVQSDHANEALLLLRNGAIECATKVVQTNDQKRTEQEQEAHQAKLAAREEHDDDDDDAAAGEDTALFQACRHGNTMILEQMLEHGVDVNFQLPSNGDTALHVACMYGMEDVVELLLHQPAIQLNALNTSGQTCLFGCSNAHIVQMLLRKGIDASIQDVDAETAWSIAEALGDTEIAQLLHSSQ